MSFSDFKFAEDDARVIANKLKDFFEAVKRANGEPGFRLALASPERLIQLTEAAILAQVNHDIDKTGKNNLLFFADDTTIDHHGYLYGERGKRMTASYALTTIRYTLSIQRAVRTLIPKGNRTTPDNKVFFATLRQVEILPGELFVDVEAQCLTPGIEGDGWDIDDIKNLVDLIPFVTARNITPSTGGDEQESTEAYRQRLRMLPESFSVAGPDGAYEFWARSANPGIIDAKAWMPELDLQNFGEFLAPWGINDAEGFYKALGNYYRDSGTGPGNVNVTVLMKEGELPTDEVLNQVALTVKPHQPLTDFFHTIHPEPIQFDVDFQYWIEIEKATEAASIIESVNIATENYITWQKSRLGLDINPDKLHEAIMGCGVKRIIITEPQFKILKPYEVAQFGGSKTIIYEGLEGT